MNEDHSEEVLELRDDQREGVGTERAIAAIEAPIREARADDRRFRHLAYLPNIVEEDVAQLNQKEREYGASWKKRGGVGAFMMLARKWDRLENMVDELRTYDAPSPDSHIPGHENERVAFVAGPYDIFSHVEGSNLEGGDAESLIDTIGDLRRYLLLVEAEMRARAGVPLIGDGDAMGITVERDPHPPGADAANL